MPAVRCLASGGPLLGACTLPGLRGMPRGVGLLGRRGLWASRSGSLAVTSGLGPRRSSPAAEVLAKVWLLAVGGLPMGVAALLAGNLGSGLGAVCLLVPVLGLLLRGCTVSVRSVHGRPKRLARPCPSLRGHRSLPGTRWGHAARWLLLLSLLLLLLLLPPVRSWLLLSTRLCLAQAALCRCTAQLWLGPGSRVLWLWHRQAGGLQGRDMLAKLQHARLGHSRLGAGRWLWQVPGCTLGSLRILHAQRVSQRSFVCMATSVRTVWWQQASASGNEHIAVTTSQQGCTRALWRLMWLPRGLCGGTACSWGAGGWL